MPNLQVRNVPEALHRELKSRAALEGISLSELVLRHLKHLAERPSRAELLDRIARQPLVTLDPSAADLVREERDTR